MQEKFINLREAAEYLGLSEKKVRKFVAKGKLPAYKIGGKFVRFKLEHIEEIKRSLPAAGSQPRKAGFSDSFLDFLQFNDFYIVSMLIIAGLILVIIYF